MNSKEKKAISVEKAIKEINYLRIQHQQEILELQKIVEKSNKDLKKLQNKISIKAVCKRHEVKPSFVMLVMGESKK